MSTAQFAGMTRAQAEGFMPNAQPQPVRKRLAEWVAARDVIDIGCGKAEEVDLYRPEQYLGIDCSAELVALARARWPRYLFEVCAALELETHWQAAIMKAVLEHLPQREAVAIYDHVRAHTDVLYVAWHTEPGKTEKLTTYQELGATWVQNRHRRDLFDGVVAREVCGAHTIWTVV